MLEKRKAKRIYRKMIIDMNQYGEAIRGTEYDDGFDRGFIVLPKKRVNIKLTEHLLRLAKQDGLNFVCHPVQRLSDPREYYMMAIDNETDEYKATKQAKIEAYLDSVVSEMEGKNRDNIINMEEYWKHHHR